MAVSAITGQSLARDRVEGAWRNPEVPPRQVLRRGLVGETWFPPRERAKGERRSRRDGFQRGLQLLERPHDRQPVGGDAIAVSVPAHELEEVLALEPQRLVVRDLRAPDVPRASPPLPIAVRRLLGRLLVDGHLALELHVVEDDHLLLAD